MDTTTKNSITVNESFGVGGMLGYLDGVSKEQLFKIFKKKSLPKSDDGKTLVEWVLQDGSKIIQIYLFWDEPKRFHVGGGDTKDDSFFPKPFKEEEVKDFLSNFGLDQFYTHK